MASYIHGTFKDIKNNTIEVQIRSANGDEEITIGENANSSVFFDADPVVIISGVDDLFSVFYTTQARITL